MAKSFYKGERLGSLPACAICGGAGEGRRAELHLPGGVRVWLCAAHRSPAFLSRRAGRDVAASLLHVWRAAGCLTARRSRAIDLHLARLVAELPPRERPGSYAWGALRAEAEACFASGERPAAVIRRLRSREEGGPARPPSVATMQRWFREGRWLGGGPPGPPPQPPEPQPPAATPPPAHSGGRRGALVRGGPAVAVPAEAQVAHAALHDRVGEDQDHKGEQTVEAADPLVGVGEPSCTVPMTASAKAGAMRAHCFQ